MGTNRPWNRKFTVLKTIKVMLVRPPMTNFRIAVWADCAISACSPLSPSIKALAHWQSVKGVSFWTGVCPPPSLANIWNKAHLPFHQSCLCIDFWVVSSQIHFQLQVHTQKRIPHQGQVLSVPTAQPVCSEDASKALCSLSIEELPDSQGPRLSRFYQ